MQEEVPLTVNQREHDELITRRNESHDNCHLVVAKDTKESLLLRMLYLMSLLLF